MAVVPTLRVVKGAPALDRPLWADSSPPHTPTLTVTAYE